MKKLLYALVCLLWGYMASAQKVPIDSGVYRKWNTPVLGNISSDGKYAFCKIPISNGYQTVLRSLSSDWKMNLGNTKEAVFSPDNRWAVYRNAVDSLIMIEPAADGRQSVPHVAAWCFLGRGQGINLIYLTKKPTQELVIRDLVSGKQRILPDITNFFIHYTDGFRNDNTTDRLVLVSNSTDGLTALDWLENATSKPSRIWHGKNPDNIIFNAAASCLAFTAESKTIYFYKPGFSEARELWHQQVSNADTLDLKDLSGFDASGSQLFIKLARMPVKPQLLPNAPKLDVYSYFDPKLQSEQLAANRWAPALTYALHMENGQLTQLEKQPDGLFPLSTVKSVTTVLVREGEGGSGSEEYWNRTAARKIWLVSTVDGSRHLLTNGVVHRNALSPDERYAIYFEPGSQTYFSYETSTGKRRNLTKGTATKWTTYDRDDEWLATRNILGIAGWCLDGDVLLYSQDDIFKVDPSGRKRPVNLTHNSLSADRLVYRLVEADGKQVDQRPLVKVFDRNTKAEGFYRLDLAKRITSPPPLAPYHFTAFQKAHDADVILVTRQDADCFPNIYATTDLKHFKALTNIQPQQNYNWLTSELVTWKTFNGSTCQAILYKPENFDPRKRYPVIFHYYEREAELTGLHSFPMPERNGSSIDIASFVSRGYMVAVTDIHFNIGNPGADALNAVASLARELAKRPYVDTKRLGLNGHSYGGYMTEYIIAHSKLFAAAIASSGWTNFISASNRIRPGSGAYAQNYYEYDKQRMGGNLWDHPQNYINASPIFQAYQVSTPLLMMNNHQDDNVDFYEGVQFFTALRRMGKTCWMLQYDDGKHGVFSTLSVADYMKREQQFFDHYLMGQPAPKWMVEGLPASQKGSTLGYDLEPVGVEPPRNLLIPAEQKKVNKIANRP